MKASSNLLSVLVLAGVVALTTCLTNGEFYKFVKQHADEFHEEDIDPAVVGNTDDDTISLPGGEDDEIDVVALMANLGLNSPNDDKEEDESEVSWWHHHYYHHNRYCHCHRYGCTCCISRGFHVRMFYHHIRFHFRACVSMAYVPHHYGIRLTFSINRHVLYSRYISLRRPPYLCYHVRGLYRYVRICLQLYHVNYYHKSACARVVAIINLKYKRYRIRFNIACFRIPFGEDDLNRLLGESKNWAFEQMSADDDGLEAAEAIDLMSDASSFLNANEARKSENVDEE